MDLGPLNDIYNRVYLFVQSVLLDDVVKERIESVVDENLKQNENQPNPKELRDLRVTIIKEYRSISHRMPSLPSLERINFAIQSLFPNRQNDVSEETYMTEELRQLLTDTEIIELANEIESDIKENPTLEKFCSLLLSYHVKICEIATEKGKKADADVTQEITFAICLLQKNSKFKKKLKAFEKLLKEAQTKEPTLEILKPENEDELALVDLLFTKFIANFDLIENQNNI